MDLCIETFYHPQGLPATLEILINWAIFCYAYSDMKCLAGQDRFRVVPLNPYLLADILFYSFVVSYITIYDENREKWLCTDQPSLDEYMTDVLTN